MMLPYLSSRSFLTVSNAAAVVPRVSTFLVPSAALDIDF